MTGKVYASAARIEARLRANLTAPVVQVDAALSEDGSGDGILYCYSTNDLVAFASFTREDLGGATAQRLADLVQDALVGAAHHEMVH